MAGKQVAADKSAQLRTGCRRLIIAMPILFQAKGRVVVPGGSFASPSGST